MTRHIFLSVVLMSLVTLGVRFLPFMLFRDPQRVPHWVHKLGRLLPYAVMAMLLVFGLRDTRFSAAADFMPELLACLLVAVTFIWWRNSLVSIVLGTLAYMFLLQQVF